MTAEALHRAIARDDAALLDELLRGDPALAGARDPNGVSAVMKAVYRRRPLLLERLLPLAPPLDVFEAAALGREERLAALLDEDPARARAWSADGGTALHFAAFFRQPGCARLLLERGADGSVHAPGFGNVAPIHSATASRAIEIVRMLLARGALVDDVQDGGWTPLMSAAHSGDEALAELLLDHGADPRKKADDGSDAIAKADEAGHGALADRLRAAAKA